MPQRLPAAQVVDGLQASVGEVAQAEQRARRGGGEVSLNDAVIANAGARPWDRDDIESRIVHVLARKMARRGSGGYGARSAAQVTAQLHALFAHQGLRDVEITQLARMTGPGVAAMSFGLLGPKL